MTQILKILRDAVAEFLREDPFTLAAALSYYSLLSMAPLLLVVVGVAGVFFGEEAARGEVVGRLADVMGSDAAGFVADVLTNAHRSGAGWFSAVVGLVGVIIGATTAFSQLQGAINKIWGVEPVTRPLREVVRVRGLAFIFVLLLGAAVVTLLVASSVISNLRGRPGLAALGPMWRVIDLVGPMVLMTALFAALFRWLPDARVRWRDVWIGAAVTSLLFIVGRLVIGIYLGRTGIASAYGAAGSAIVVLIWTYYSAILILFGAELTQVRAATLGGGLQPRSTASTKGHVLKDSKAQARAMSSEAALPAAQRRVP
ncbi:MAG: YihY/virulence factor BrkB family protein [Nannocystaceae bacterium]